MSAVKERAKRLIDSLPEHTTWDDIMYRMYVRQKVEIGLGAAERGEILPHQDVKKLFDQSQ